MPPMEEPPIHCELARKSGPQGHHHAPACVYALRLAMPLSGTAACGNIRRIIHPIGLVASLTQPRFLYFHNLFSGGAKDRELFSLVRGVRKQGENTKPANLESSRASCFLLLRWELNVLTRKHSNTPTQKLKLPRRVILPMLRCGVDEPTSSPNSDPDKQRPLHKCLCVPLSIGVSRENPM